MKDLDFSFNKLPPSSREAEERVLGGILIENNALNTVLEHISRDDFYLNANREIFSALIELTEKRQPCDTVFLYDYLQGKGLLESVGGPAYIAGLTENTFSAANIEHYAKLVKEKAIARTLIGTAGKILEKAYCQNGSELERLLDDAQHEIVRISAQGKRSSFADLKPLVRDVLGQVEERYNHKGSLIGLSTGLKDLDYITCGLQRSELIILAARPSMGKTALALNIAINSALNEIPTAFFSLEMSKEQIILRGLSSESRINSRGLRNGLLSDADWSKITAAAGQIGRLS